MNIKDCKVGMPVRVITSGHGFLPEHVGRIFIISQIKEGAYFDEGGIRAEGYDGQEYVGADSFEPAYSLEVGCKVGVVRSGSSLNGMIGTAISEQVQHEGRWEIKDDEGGLVYFYEKHLIVIEPAPKNDRKFKIGEYVMRTDTGTTGNITSFDEKGWVVFKSPSGSIFKGHPDMIASMSRPEPAIPSKKQFRDCIHVRDCHKINMDTKGSTPYRCNYCEEAGKHLYKGCDCHFTVPIEIKLPEGYQKGMAKDIAKMLREDTKMYHGTVGVDWGSVGDPLADIQKVRDVHYEIFGKPPIDYTEMLKDSICKALDVDRSVLDIQPGHTRPLIDIDYPKINMFPPHLLDRLKVSSAMHGIALEQWKRIIGGNKMEDKTLEEVCKQLKITIVGSEGSSHILSDGRVGEFNQKEVSVPITEKDNQTFIKRLPASIKDGRAFIDKDNVTSDMVFITYEFIEARSSKERREEATPTKKK